MKPVKKSISIFDYTDYRCFLKDLFFAKKEHKANFSFRSFNRRAGIQSSGFLKLVMDGKRNLAEDGIRKITKGFDLNEGEGDYFENLVRFNQAKTHEEKDHYFKSLAKNSKFRKAKTLLVEQYDLFSHWYYVAILEAVRMEGEGVKDASWLAARLHPAVGIREIKKAIRDLTHLGFLSADAAKSLVRHEPMLSTPDEVQSLAVTNFHAQMSQLAIRAVENETHEKREFSALTVATSEASFNQVKKEIQEFRKKIHAILEQDENGKKEVVAQINFQLFQLTQKENL